MGTNGSDAVLEQSYTEAVVDTVLPEDVLSRPTVLVDLDLATVAAEATQASAILRLCKRFWDGPAARGLTSVMGCARPNPARRDPALRGVVRLGGHDLWCATAARAHAHAMPYTRRCMLSHEPHVRAVGQVQCTVW